MSFKIFSHILHDLSFLKIKHGQSWSVVGHGQLTIQSEAIKHIDCTLK